MKKHNWTNINSSNIERVAYDEITKELLVDFKNGKEYYYINVPKLLYEDLLNSTSKGKFLNEKIKGDYGYGRNN